MILYTAGNMNPQVLAGMAERTEGKNWLETNAHKGSRDCADYFGKDFACYNHRFRLFIDSGAFTAWIKGKPIDHQAYIDYGKDLLANALHPDRVVFASLDVIPGNFADMIAAGKKAAAMHDATVEEMYNVFHSADPSTSDVQDAAAKGWANFEKERAAGFNTIPTFHQLDPWEFLDRMIAECDYIGISPRKVNMSTQEKGKWLNEVFQRIDRAGRAPKPGNMHNAIKTHGLGVSSPVFMETFPFYSVDSTRWLQGGNGYYFHFDGTRIQLVMSSDWGGLGPSKWGETTNTLSAIHHYKAPYQAKLVYYYHERAIRADAEMNAHIIEHWKLRGVDWKHDDEYQDAV